MVVKKISRVRKFNFWFFMWIFSLFLNIFLVGAFFNAVAVLNNYGKMPVKADWNVSEISDRHFSFTNNSEVNFYYFTDIIYIYDGYYSLGDLLMVFGFSLIFFFDIFLLVSFIRNRKINLEKKK